MDKVPNPVMNVVHHRQNPLDSTNLYVNTYDKLVMDLWLYFHRATTPFSFLSDTQKANKKTPWSESASELRRPSDRRLSAKWLPTFADKGCHVVSVTDPYGRILGFLDRSRYFSIK
jgi:hypothetical protein